MYIPNDLYEGIRSDFFIITYLCIHYSIPTKSTKCRHIYLSTHTPSYCSYCCLFLDGIKCPLGPSFVLFCSLM